MHDVPTFGDPVRRGRTRLFPRMRERRRRALAALSGALFGGIVNGITAQIFLIPFAEIRSWAEYLAVWALAVVFGAALGGFVLKATVDRFDYRIPYFAAVAALVTGQAQAALQVWFHLAGLLPLGVVSLLASALVVWVVTSFVATRATPELL